MIPYKRVSTHANKSDSSDDIDQQDTAVPIVVDSDVIGKNAAHETSNSFWSVLKTSFLSLRGAPRELYINFILKFCESYGYFALSQILVIYLHQEFGVSDMQAGAAYGMWGAAITFWGFVTACFNDKLGVRLSLLIGFFISGLSAVILTFARSKMTVYFTLFGILPIGNSIGIPMLTVGIKRYTTSQNRGFAFGLFYAVMNIAALASGPIVDFFNIIITPPSGGATTSFWTGNRMVIFSVVINYLISWSVTYFFLREININDPLHNDNNNSATNPNVNATREYELVSNEYSSHEGVAVGMNDGKDDNSPNSSRPHNPLHQTITIVQRTASGTGAFTIVEDDDDDEDNFTDMNESDVNVHQKNTNSVPTTLIIQDLLMSATFWRFVILTLFLINLRTIFRHVDATLPTYLIRTFGESYPKGMIYSINPFLIIWLTPTVAALTTTWPHFDMIKYGSYVSAISPFFLVFSTSTWAVVSFMVLLSIGEAIWSPRLYDYTMSIAPEGKEATFSSLAAAPLFAAKIPVGLLSGYLISTYLPEDKNEKPNGPMLWLIIGLLTLTSPILITVFEKCIREPDKNTHPVDHVLIEHIHEQDHSPLHDTESGEV